MKLLAAWILALSTLTGVCTAGAADTLVRREWTVDGVVREALVYLPPQARTNASPVVFVFHGHGGTMQNAARSFGIHRLWPEAIVVYPQGLNTPGRLTDPEGKRPGWQPAVGDQGDRDLKFYDAMLKGLKEDYQVDAKRIYATGLSNGGGFTYLLWAARGEQFAAFAPCSSIPARNSAKLTPAPVLHVAGRNDPLVKFAWQQATIDMLRQVNQCGEGKEWGQWCMEYPSKVGAPVVAFIHPGAHGLPASAPTAIVRFFQQHARP